MARFFAALNVFRPPVPSICPLLPTTLKKQAASPFKCCSGSGPAPEDENEAHRRGKATLLGVPTNTWSAGLGTIGFLETSYLTYLKLTNAEAFCPVGGGSCGDVLNSDYSIVYGLPLPLFGMIAYGFVTLLSLKQSEKTLFSGLDNSDAHLILLGTTTSMAAASAYFLILLYTKFAGTSCSYCLLSAALSFSLFFISLKDLTLEEIRNKALLQLAVAGVVFFALTNSYTIANPQYSGLNYAILGSFETEITTQSTEFAISLAKHLSSIGAKMYGAFWCSHCNEQKQMFGREAVKFLDYVECFPEGAGKGKKMIAECAAVGIEGFPTWVIKDKVLSGEQELQDLAEASGFNQQVSASEN